MWRGGEGMLRDGMEGREMRTARGTQEARMGCGGRWWRKGTRCRAKEKGWNRLDATWEAEVDERHRSHGMDGNPMTPMWKLWMLSDGSVTRHLELVTDCKVDVDCFDMHVMEPEETETKAKETRNRIPADVDAIHPPLLQRQVYLRVRGNANAYAASWWCSKTVDGFLKDRNEPIWTNLSTSRTELYREVKRLYRGNNQELEREFQQPGPFWGRHYTFYHHGKPLTVIYEVFSPALERYLGPSCVQEPDEVPDPSEA